MSVADASRLKVLASGFHFTEDPRWHGDELWFSDMYGNTVRAIDAQGRITCEVRLDDMPSGLGWLPGGDLLIVAVNQRRILRRSGDGLSVHADLTSVARYGINDMIVDPLGRCYVSQFGFDITDGSAPKPSPIILVTAQGMVRPASPDLMMANGMALTDGHRSLVAAETLGHRLTEFDIDSTGALINPRSFATLEEGHMPDGICIDAAGAIWAACPGAGAILRIERGGRVTDRIPLPGGRAAYACMLGGSDRRTLHLCTSPAIGSPLFGTQGHSRIETLPVCVPGPAK